MRVQFKLIDRVITYTIHVFEVWFVWLKVCHLIVWNYAGSLIEILVNIQIKQLSFGKYNYVIADLFDRFDLTIRGYCLDYGPIFFEESDGLLSWAYKDKVFIGGAGSNNKIVHIWVGFIF